MRRASWPQARERERIKARLRSMSSNDDDHLYTGGRTGYGGGYAGAGDDDPFAASVAELMQEDELGWWVTQCAVQYGTAQCNTN